MEGERDFEFVPIHRTAFAERLDLEPAYAHEVDAHLQLSAVLKWIDERMANGLTAH